MDLNSILSEAVIKKPQSKRASSNFTMDINKLRRMGLNENVYGMAPGVLKVYEEEAKHGNLYGDFGGGPLKQALAEFYGGGLTPDNFDCGAGSSAMIEKLGGTFLNPGDEVLMCPTFAAFIDMATIRMAVPVIVPLKEDKGYDLDALAEAVTPKTKMIIVTNPNNPTGQCLKEKELLAFIEKTPKNVVIAFDEAYLEYSDDPEVKSMYPLIKKMPDRPIVVQKTFSKYYGMAGVRIGYAMAAEEIIAKMRTVPGSSLNRPGMYAAIQALKEQEYYKEACAKIIAGRTYIQDELTKLGVTVYPSHTNFILFDAHRDYTKVREMLIERGILINNPMLNRVSVSTKEDNEYFIECMKEILEILPVIE